MSTTRKPAAVFQVAFTDEEATPLRSVLGPDAAWVDANAMRGVEPALAPTAGAVLHRGDGAVDAAALMNAVSADAG